MHNKAPFHVFKFTHELFEHKSFTGEKRMKWQTSSSDLNPIENLWSILMKLYEDGKQYNCKADLWEAIKTTMSQI